MEKKRGLSPWTGKNAYVVFCRKKVVKKSLISTNVGHTFKQAKSGGCKKLRYRAASSYADLSEKKILQVTNNEFKYRVHNAKFTNKATPKPVTAKHVQSQHQIDLIDLSKDPVKHNGKVYKYVMSCPSKVYFVRKSNILVKASLENEADLNACIIKAPKRKDYRRHFRNVKKLRESAQLYSKRMNERMVRRQARLHKIPAYKHGDVYRPDRRGSITPKRRIVLKGTVLKKSKTNSMFKVRMVPPGD